jgi:hypothetical protein
MRKCQAPHFSGILCHNSLIAAFKGGQSGSAQGTLTTDGGEMRALCIGGKRKEDDSIINNFQNSQNNFQFYNFLPSF